MKTHKKNKKKQQLIEKNRFCSLSSFLYRLALIFLNWHFEIVINLFKKKQKNYFLSLVLSLTFIIFTSSVWTPTVLIFYRKYWWKFSVLPIEGSLCTKLLLNYLYLIREILSIKKFDLIKQGHRFFFIINRYK